jgi:CRP-like cAMP-binding protein
VFSPFSAETRARLHRIAVVRHWRTGELVLHGGGVASSILVILQGQVRLSGSSSEGDERFFRMFQPGEYVGLASALGEVPFLFDAVATGDCSIAHFNREQFLQVLA